MSPPIVTFLVQIEETYKARESGQVEHRTVKMCKPEVGKERVVPLGEERRNIGWRCSREDYGYVSSKGLAGGRSIGVLWRHEAKFDWSISEVIVFPRYGRDVPEREGSVCGTRGRLRGRGTK